MWVVTRNSHAAEIATFLKGQGVPCEGVLVAKKGVSKAAAMLEALPGLALSSGGAEDADAGNEDHGGGGAAAGAAATDAVAPVRAIFVDDSVREVCDEAIARLPGLLFRVLFRRGAVTV